MAGQNNDSESKDSESKVWHQTHVLFYLNNVSLIAYSETPVFALLFQANLSSKSRVDRILHFHYLICMLLPVLKRISENRETELETEAKIKGIFILLILMFSEVAIVSYKCILDVMLCDREKYF